MNNLMIQIGKIGLACMMLFTSNPIISPINQDVLKEAKSKVVNKTSLKQVRKSKALLKRNPIRLVAPKAVGNTTNANFVMNMQNGGDVVLSEDVTISIKDSFHGCEISNQVTLDLNGYTLTADNMKGSKNSFFNVKTNGKLVIKDSSSKSTGLINNTGDSSVIILKGGEATFQSGTIKACNPNYISGNPVGPAVLVNSGIFHMQGGTINYNQLNEYTAILIEGTGKMDFSGGLINEEYNEKHNVVKDVYLIENSGELTMSGSATIQYKGTATNPIYGIANRNKTVINGGSILITKNKEISSDADNPDTGEVYGICNFHGTVDINNVKIMMKDITARNAGIAVLNNIKEKININGGSFTGVETGIVNKGNANISNATIEATKGTGLVNMFWWNVGDALSIKDSSIIGNTYGIENVGGLINVIDNVNIKGITESGVYNNLMFPSWSPDNPASTGVITNISGGKIQTGNPTKPAIKNEGTINEISDGEFSGTQGLGRATPVASMYGLENSSIGKITKISGGTFKGSNTGLMSRAGGTIGSITGGTFIGNDGKGNAITFSNDTVVEPNLTTGFGSVKFSGKLDENGNKPTYPTGYHISKGTTTESNLGSLKLHYFTKDYKVETIVDGKVVVTQVEGGQTAPKPNTPSKEGFEFEGWYSDEACTTPVDMSNYIVTGNEKIYAKLVENKYVVKYDTKGGNLIPDKTDVLFNDKNLMPKEPIKEGYTFKGWQVDGKAVDESNTYKSLVKDDKVTNVTWVAEWLKNQTKPDPKPTIPPNGMVDTGDDMNYYFYVGMLFVSMLSGAYVLKKKKVKE